MQKQFITRSSVFFFLAFGIVFCGILILEEVFIYISTFKKYTTIATLIKFVIIIVGFFGVLAIGPLQGWLARKWYEMEQTEKYGKEYWLLSEREKNMIDKILLEMNLPEGYGADTKIQEEAKRRVEEESMTKRY